MRLRQKSPNRYRGLATKLGVIGLARMIDDSANDPGGHPAAPELYKLIGRINSDNYEPLLSHALLRASLLYVKHYLHKANRRQVITFLTMLRRTKLLVEGEIQEALLEYADKYIDPISRNTADIAVAAFARGAGKSYARRWLPVLISQLETSPSWRVIDVLAAILGLVSEQEYSRPQFLSDLDKLRTTPNFTSNVEERASEWAKLQMLPADINSARWTAAGPPIFAEIPDFIAGVETAQCRQRDRKSNGGSIGA